MSNIRSMIKLCTRDRYVGGRQCNAVVVWRIRVHNAGPTASQNEAQALLDAAPRCVAWHRTEQDRRKLHDLTLASLVGIAMEEGE